MDEKFFSSRSKTGEAVLIWELRRKGEGLEWRQWLQRASERKAGEEVAKDLWPTREQGDAAAEAEEEEVKEDRKEREEAARRMEEDAFLYMTKKSNHTFRCRWLRKIRIMIWWSDESDEDDHGGDESDDWRQERRVETKWSLGLRAIYELR